jgi:hypothetical protein
MKRRGGKSGKMASIGKLSTKPKPKRKKPKKRKANPGKRAGKRVLSGLKGTGL